MEVKISNSDYGEAQNWEVLVIAFVSWKKWLWAISVSSIRKNFQRGKPRDCYITYTVWFSSIEAVQSVSVLEFLFNIVKVLRLIIIQILWSTALVARVVKVDRYSRKATYNNRYFRKSASFTSHKKSLCVISSYEMSSFFQSSPSTLSMASKCGSFYE